MFSYRVKNKTSIKICDAVNLLVDKKCKDKIIFSNEPLYAFDKIPDDNMLDSIDDNLIYFKHIGYVWLIEDVLKVMDRFIFHSNLMWDIENYNDERELKFSQLNWNWCYHCADDSWVELFTQDIYLSKIIEKEFEVEPIEFPGTVYQYLYRQNL